MMERTIGGVPVKEVFEKLKGDIPNVVQYTSDGLPYLPVGSLKQFFDETVPLQNYDFTVTDLKYVETTNLESVENDEEANLPDDKRNAGKQTDKYTKTGNRACFTCLGTLTINDDEGRKVATKSSVGSNNVIFLEKTGQAKDLATDAKSAVSAAMKECIRLFGCGERQLEDAKKRAKEGAGKGNNYGYTQFGARTGSTQTYKQGASQPPQPKPQQNPAPVRPVQNAVGNANPNQGNMPAVIAPMANTATAPQTRARMPKTGAGTFRLVLNDKEQAFNSYKMVLLSVYCRDYGNYETKLLIWKNRKNNPKLQKILDRINTGCEFECKGTFELRAEQYRIVLDEMEV